MSQKCGSMKTTFKLVFQNASVVALNDITYTHFNLYIRTCIHVHAYVIHAYVITIICERSNQHVNWSYQVRDKPSFPLAGNIIHVHCSNLRIIAMPHGLNPKSRPLVPWSWNIIHSFLSTGRFKERITASYSIKLLYNNEFCINLHVYIWNISNIPFISPYKSLALKYFKLKT